MAARLPSRYADVPEQIPESLSDLHGPTAGTVPLPLHLSWSGARRYDVTDPSARLAMYQIVITEGERSDVEGFLDATFLLGVWPKLRRLLGPGYRVPWEERFPELVEAARVAEPALREELRKSRMAIREGRHF